MDIEIFPLKGIRVDGSLEIDFGIKRDVLKNILGNPDSGEIKCFYNRLEARLDFDKNDELEFIEFINGPYCENIKLSIYGINPFETPADELVKILTKNGNNNVDDYEAKLAYYFLDISVGIWRAIDEETMKEDIIELKKCGEYEKNKKALEKDLIKSKYFWTIGIGIKNYYNK